MRLQTITIEGFRSFRLPETVDLSGIALAAITGPNHAGKTSILRAIEYALYGPQHGEAKTLANRSSKQMKVVLTIKVGNDTYIIERSHKGDGTGHKVMVTQDGDTPILVSSRDLATTQTFINELVGMGREVARVTWMSMQGDIEVLAGMDGPTRRATFVKAFGLDRFDALAKLAKDARREQARELDRLNGKLAGLSEALDSDPELADWTDKELTTELERHDAFDKAERDRAERQRLEERRDSLSAEVVDLNDAAADLEVAEKMLGPATEVLDAAREALSVALAEKSRTAAEHATAERTVASLQREVEAAEARPEGDCDRCGQHLTPQAHGFVVKALTEALGQAQTELAGARTAKDSAVAVWEHRNNDFTMASAATRIANDRVHSARNAASTLARVRRELDEVADRLSGLSATADVAEPSTDRHAISDEMHTRKLRVEREALAEGVAAEVVSVAERLSNLDMLAAAWSPAGIPMTILRGVADSVTSDANAILYSMGSDLSVDIDASGASVDLLVGGAGWSSLSGQERFYVALSLRLALGRAVAQRTGHEVATMLLDEGWGALDPEHAQKAVEALAGLTKRVGILTVTHIEDIGSQMPQQIEVDATSGTSRASRI